MRCFALLSFAAACLNYLKKIQRSGNRLTWRLISRVRGRIGHRPTPQKVPELVSRMVVENPTCGAPRCLREILESRKLAHRQQSGDKES